MKKPYKVAKCGSMDSKYFGNLNKLDNDIEKSNQEEKDIRIKIRELLLSNPSKMEENFHILLDELKIIKQEYYIN